MSNAGPLETLARIVGEASAGACAQLPDAVGQLVTAIDGGDDGAMLSAAVTVGQRIVQAVTAFTQLSSALDQAIQGAGGLTPAQITRLRDAAQAIPERLVHLALISYLKEHAPSVKGGLALAGLIDDTPVPADPSDPTTPPYTLARLRFDPIATANPSQ